jgi:hypothetical protein
MLDYKRVTSFISKLVRNICKMFDKGLILTKVYKDS